MWCWGQGEVKGGNHSFEEVCSACYLFVYDRMLLRNRFLYWRSCVWFLSTNPSQRSFVFSYSVGQSRGYVSPEGSVWRWEPSAFSLLYTALSNYQSQMLWEASSCQNWASGICINIEPPQSFRFFSDCDQNLLSTELLNTNPWVPLLLVVRKEGFEALSASLGRWLSFPGTVPAFQHRLWHEQRACHPSFVSLWECSSVTVCLCLSNVGSCY